MGTVGLGLDCASNHVGDGVVRRHGRAACFGEECGIWDCGVSVSVCARARKRTFSFARGSGTCDGTEREGGRDVMK